MSEEKKLNGTVIVTYRCNARCSMCNRYKAPSKPEEEISIETIKKLPKMYFTNITGGEPFIRTDLKDIVRELYKKSDRIVISTNGFFTDRIVDLCKEFPQIGIRISIEGLEQTNNEIRGLQNGYQRGYGTLKKLREMGMKDVGFGMTVQDKNAPDLVPLYKISDEMGMEFATASLHNSFYFRKTDNKIDDKYHVAQNFEALINELLQSKSRAVKETGIEHLNSFVCFFFRSVRNGQFRKFDQSVCKREQDQCCENIEAGVNDCDAGCICRGFQEWKMYKGIDSIEENQEKNSTDDIKIKVNHCGTACIAACTDGGEQCGDTCTDILSHDDRDRCRIADCTGFTKCLQNTDRCR